MRVLFRSAPYVVLAVAAVDAVVAGSAEQGLGFDRVRIVDRLVRTHGAAARAAVDHVVAGAAVDLVATGAAEQRVAAGAAVDLVAAGATVQDVVAAVAVQDVVAAVAVQEIVAVAAPNDLVAAPAIDDVDAAAAIVRRVAVFAVIDAQDVEERETSECHGHVPPEVMDVRRRSEEHTSELQSLMRISYAVFCLKKKKSRDRQRLHNLTDSRSHKR